MTLRKLSASELAIVLMEMSSRSITGMASRIKRESLTFICDRLAGGDGISPDAEPETINLRLIRLLTLFPQHFYPAILSDEDI